MLVVFVANRVRLTSSLESRAAGFLSSGGFIVLPRGSKLGAEVLAVAKETEIG